MLLIKNEIGISPVAGIGLFSGQDLKKGDIVWRFHKAVDLVYSTTILGNPETPDVLEEMLRKHAYPLNNAYEFLVLPLDNDRYFNHSDNPNVGDGEEFGLPGYEVALRDIKKGEELTCDYRRFDPEFKLCASFLK